MANGGKRPGAGRKKGFRFPKTLEKEAAREAVRVMVTAALAPLVEAQIANAIGVKYLVKRDKDGTYKPVTEEEAKALPAESVLEVRDKIPNVQAFSDLMNRALDLPAKPKEEIDAKVTHRFLWGSE